MQNIMMAKHKSAKTQLVKLTEDNPYQFDIFYSQT